MTQSIVPVKRSSGRSQKVIRIIFSIVFVCVLIYAARVVSRTARSKDQNEFESWLAMASVQIMHEKDLTVLPVLNLKVVGDGDAVLPREMTLSAGNDVESRERVVRILELVREAGLFAARRGTNAEPASGDLVLNVTSPAKTFNLIVPRRAVETNVKAGLMLKLFDEFSRTPPSAMARLSDNEVERAMMLTDQFAGD